MKWMNLDWTKRGLQVLGLTLGLALAGFAVTGNDLNALQVSECGNERGQLCSKDQICTGWWIFKACMEKYEYYPLYAVDSDPARGGF